MIRAHAVEGLLTALLLAVLPTLMLYAHNASQLHPAQAVRALLVAAAAAALVYAAAGAWLRQAPSAAVVAGGSLILLQSFGPLVSVLESMGVPLQPARVGVAALSAAILTMLFVVARRAVRPSPAWASAQRSLLCVAALLALWQVGRVAWIERTAGSGPTESARAPSDAHTARAARAQLPDIYFVLLDGYGGHDVLAQRYGFDNTTFLDALRDMGFAVAERSRANYPGTLWALASILNLDYLQDLLDVDASLTHMNPLIRLVRSNRVVHTLRDAGYEIVTLAGGYGVAEFGNPDVYLQMQGSYDDFEQLLLQATPLGWLAPRQAGAHEVHRRRLRWVFDTLPALPVAARPQFVFAHVLAPHPPFVYDADGDRPAWPRTFALNDGSDYYKLGGATPEDYQRGYAGQVRWVTQRTLETLQRLLRSRPTPPVVVLLSDHGPGAGLDWNSVSDTDVWERYSILAAMHLPGAPDGTVPDDLSPAAAFRLVFDVVLGSDLGPLPPRSWFASTQRPFAFVDVSDRLLSDPPTGP